MPERTNFPFCFSIMPFVIYSEGVCEINMKKYNNYDLHFIFEVKDGITFKNSQYIHPLKQRLVNEYVNYFKNNSNIKAAIIFGSGVEFRCNSYSDLDICIERYDVEMGLKNRPECDEEVDIVYEDMIGGRLQKEIEEKGIVVFDREEIYV